TTGASWAPVSRTANGNDATTGAASDAATKDRREIRALTIRCLLLRTYLRTHLRPTRKRLHKTAMRECQSGLTQDVCILSLPVRTVQLPWFFWARCRVSRLLTGGL